MTASLNNHYLKIACENLPLSLLSNKKRESNHYLKAILEGDEKGIRKMYQDLMPLIVSIILKNNGTTNDAQDVFQDAIIIIYQKAQNGNMEAIGSFKGYFTGICKYVWMNKLRRKHRQDVSIDTDHFHSLRDPASDMDQLLHQREMKKLFREKFDLLEGWQQQLLELSFAGKSHKEIAIIMGFSSEGYTKKKKFLAKKRLIELIQTDPRYNELVI